MAMSAAKAEADKELERVIVSYIKDFTIVRNFYENNPSKFNDGIEHINGVLALPHKDEKRVTIELHLELRFNSHDPIDFLCSPSWTVLATKYQICEQFKQYDVKNLFVLYGTSIAKDWDYLSDCGIEQDGDILYVYIRSPQSNTISHQQKRIREISDVNPHREPPVTFPEPLRNNFMDIKFESPTVMAKSPMVPEAVDNHSLGSLWTCKICTFLNESWRKECVMCNSPCVGDMDVPKATPVDIFGKIADFETVIPGWKCPQCTYINEPTRPGCEICAGARPADYKVPDDYELSDKEKERIMKEKQAEENARRQESFERRENYTQHISAEERDIIPSSEPVECMICFTETDPEDSIVLRECLHKFCKDCVIGQIKNTEEATVPCPYSDDEYQCRNTITHREIKALLSEEDFQKFLDRGLMQAESASPNSFHCKTPDCHGWCVYEDDVNTFKCPVCHKVNCVLCKAIHEGKNCKQYQDELTQKSATDQHAKKTKDLLAKMLKSGDAMHCPRCNIIIQKKIGCDWIRCSMCKEEICWVTKGPRWGPNGPGDVSGGCRCRVNGKPCHVNCKNCH